ncbi:MAG: sialate O-acetylesterase [Chthonomonadales bacterium]
MNVTSIRHTLRVLGAACILSFTASACAQPVQPFLSPLFTDNMVLQRGMRDPVWGWTTPGATVTVEVAGKRATAVADASGKWMARIGPFSAGGPFTLNVKGPEQRTLHNVMVGDVWLCSGQSNMQMGIANVNNAAEEIAHADYPSIRLFTVPMEVAYAPRSTVSGAWQVCTPQTISQDGWGGFSAVAYFFGRALHQTLKVPIGLIHSSWGGTIAEAWTSAEALQKLPDFAQRLEQVERIRAAGEASLPANQRRNPNVCTVLYNAMIAPLIPFGMKGVIWYQGESNAGRAYQYRTLLPALIQDWRTRWNEGPFPFLIVQLANFLPVKPQPGEDEWAELREAQLLTAEHVPNCGLAVTIDIGDAADIHPKNKQEVGRRLALAALAIAYKRHLEYSGPIYKSYKREDSAIRLFFTHVDGGLVAHGDTLQGFAIAGSDRKFVWADARIEGDTVVVSSQAVPDPVAVRYGWAINPVVNLYNREGLPASPFRTDDWPGLTYNRK